MRNVKKTKGSIGYEILRMKYLRGLLHIITLPDILLLCEAVDKVELNCVLNLYVRRLGHVPNGRYVLVSLW